MDEAWPAVVDSGGRQIDRIYFCGEGCGTFALVLAKRAVCSGKRALVTVASRDGGERWSDEFDAEVTHVLVRTTDGYWDVHGRARCVTEALERAGMAVTGERFSEDDYEVEAFERRFMGDDEKPLYAADEETKGWAHRIIMASPERFGVPG